MFERAVEKKLGSESSLLLFTMKLRERKRFLGRRCPFSSLSGLSDMFCARVSEEEFPPGATPRLLVIKSLFTQVILKASERASTASVGWIP